MRTLLPLFAISIGIYSLTEVGLPLAIRDHGLPATTLGLMATLNAAMVVILQPIATSVLSRFRSLWVYVLASSLISIGVALTGVAHNAWSFAGTVVLWSLGEASIGGIHATIIAGIAPENARGRYQGAFQWSWGIARFAALTAGTAVYAHAGPPTLWWFSAIAGIAAALAVGALAPVINRRTTTPEPTSQPTQNPVAA